VKPAPQVKAPGGGVFGTAQGSRLCRGNGGSADGDGCARMPAPANRKVAVHAANHAANRRADDVEQLRPAHALDDRGGIGDRVAVPGDVLVGADEDELAAVEFLGSCEP
jgi:hypothetical protein